MMGTIRKELLELEQCTYLFVSGDRVRSSGAAACPRILSRASAYSASFYTWSKFFF